MKVTKARSTMPYLPPAGDEQLRLNLIGFTWQPVMSTGMRARMAMMLMQMCRKKYCKLMLDQRIMWRTDGIVCLSWEPVMSTDIRARMVTMRMQMRRRNHRKPMMHHCRMSRTEGIVLASVKIGQYLFDRQNMKIAKQMQWRGMYCKPRLYCNK